MSTATATVPTPAKAPAVKPRGPKFRWKLTRGIYIEDNPAAPLRQPEPSPLTKASPSR